MHVVTSYPDGIFCWVDVTTTDPEGAKSFYTRLFGWEADDVSTDEGYIYTMFRLDGKSVAGLGRMSPDMQAQGVPSFWSSYVKHNDVDSVAAKVTAAGGTLLVPPMDVMEEGRMMMAQDPTGAVFGVWQPRKHIGAQLVNMPNTLSWNELQTRHTEAASAFYQSVFGWTGKADENGYVVLAQDGRRQAGILPMDESWGDIPSNWAVYFMVEDIEATVEKARELGAHVHVPPTPAGEIGRFAVLQDPQGAVFTIIQLSIPADPPPGA